MQDNNSVTLYSPDALADAYFQAHYKVKALTKECHDTVRTLKDVLDLLANQFSISQEE